jgi:cell division protein FtsW (lipid II flippase)
LVGTRASTTEGIPLPFVSYGGSSLVASWIAGGLILNVSQHEVAESG